MNKSSKDLNQFFGTYRGIVFNMLKIGFFFFRAFDFGWSAKAQEVSASDFLTFTYKTAPFFQEFFDLSGTGSTARFSS